MGSGHAEQWANMLIKSRRTQPTAWVVPGAQVGGEERPALGAAPSQPRSLRGRTITITVLSVAGGTVVLAVPALRQVLTPIRHMSAAWLIAAVILELASCLSFEVAFRLFFDQLPPRLARQLAWAEMGSGALLPGGGIGSLAVGGWLLHLAGMPTRRILRRSSGLFFLTSAINVAALIAGGILLLSGLSSADHRLALGVPPLQPGCSPQA